MGLIISEEQMDTADIQDNVKKGPRGLDYVNPCPAEVGEIKVDQSDQWKPPNLRNKFDPEISTYIYQLEGLFPDGTSENEGSEVSDSRPFVITEDDLVHHDAQEDHEDDYRDASTLFDNHVRELDQLDVYSFERVNIASTNRLSWRSTFPTLRWTKPGTPWIGIELSSH